MSEDANRDYPTGDDGDEDSSSPRRNTKQDASAGDSNDESPPPSHPSSNKKRRRASDGEDKRAAGSDPPTLNHTPPPRRFTMALQDILSPEDTMENNANDADADDDDDDDDDNDTGADSSFFNTPNKLTPKTSQSPQPWSNRRSLAHPFTQRNPDKDKSNDAGADSSFTTRKKRGRSCTGKISQPPQPQSNRPSLACPFVKRNPDGDHQYCARFFYSHFGKLKDHVRLCHTGPIACPRCYQEFPDRDQLIYHLRELEICRLNRAPRNTHDAYDPTDWNVVRALWQRASNAGGREAERRQWYELFGTLFPGYPPPSSVYQ